MSECICPDYKPKVKGPMSPSGRSLAKLSQALHVARNSVKKVRKK